MNIRIFTLRYDALVHGFDDGPVREFLKDKELLSAREHFFLHHEVPHLTLLVIYDPLGLEPPRPTPDGKPERQRDESWRELLQPEHQPLFETLREWRGKRCRAEGLPPYIICTNRMLAEMAVNRPGTLAALAAMEGFGEAKVKKYGQDLLAILAPEPEMPAGG